MEYLIREMHVSEYPLLREFLYQAIYQRDQEKSIPRTITVSYTHLTLPTKLAV